MVVLHTINDCKLWRKQQISTVGFVPTMGALHDGHLSLIQTSKKQCSSTLVSIYINPTQFSKNEDLSSYPQTIDSDLKKLKELNVDAVFMPLDHEIYPKGTKKSFKYHNNLFDKLEGRSRPHFFIGVTRVVSILFDISNPTHTFFGEKDAQQARVIKKMIQDLKYNIHLILCPITRDKNGLALSSRNSYFSIEERSKASVIYKSLMIIKKSIFNGEKNAEKLKNIFIAEIQREPGFVVDYVSIACNESLNELKIWQPNSLISTAVFYKKVRLIDNFVY